tara:strand:+ start:484 stop:708 length:225 start_codon:yes stop_codon:yes gene_type:complete
MNNTSDIKLTPEEFKTIKLLIRKCSSSIEHVMENDFSFTQDEGPELYQHLMDMQEMWESDEIRDAIDVWTDIEY